MFTYSGISGYQSYPKQCKLSVTPSTLGRQYMSGMKEYEILLEHLMGEGPGSDNGYSLTLSGVGVAGGSTSSEHNSSKEFGLHCPQNEATTHFF